VNTPIHNLPAEAGLAPLTDSGAVPLYRQVKRALLKLLESGRYAPGQALPSETEIAQSLQVSIGTLRRAVDELVHEHVLIRRQGKGTFVALHNDDRFLFQFFHVEPRSMGTLEGMGQEREYPVVDCVAFENTRATEEQAAALRMHEGEPVFCIDNRLSLGGRPVVHDHLCLSALVFKGLTEKRFSERPSTIYNLYQMDHGISVLRAQERARAASASREVARILGVPQGLPVLEVHRVALTFGEKPVEYRISTINTQHHDYVSVLSKRR